MGKEEAGREGHRPSRLCESVVVKLDSASGRLIWWQRSSNPCPLPLIEARRR
jgi:hypothetical protein